MFRRRFVLSFLFVAIAVSALATVKPRYRGAGRGAVEHEAEVENAYSTNGPRRIGSLASAALPSKGSPKVPVILVQFSDVKFTSGLEDDSECNNSEQVDSVRLFYEEYCNGDGVNPYWKVGGSFGAISEYFRDQSNGQFTPEFVVLGPVTLDRKRSYYGANSGSRKDVRISEFYSDALKKAIPSTDIWDDFDNNKDNVVDMAFFIFAGEGENGFDLSKNPEAADYIWPKESPTGGTISDIRFGAYACCNEMYDGETDGIGVFVHELSHALGLPDFYDTNYVAYGLDYWDIMDSGCYCDSGDTPCFYSAYEREFMGWKDLIVLDGSTPQHIVLDPISSFGDAYKIVNPKNANEYLVLENRQNQLWDSYIGRCGENIKFHGLLVTHVDFNQNRWTSNSVNTNSNHQYISIVPADGELDSYMYVKNQESYNAFMYSAWGDPFPGYLNVKNLENPDSVKMSAVQKSSNDTIIYELPLNYTGSFNIIPFNQPIRNIVEHKNGTVEFDYCPNGVTPEEADIAGVQLDRPFNASFVYNLQGQCVANSSSEIHYLPAGIYLVGGKKIRVQ